MTADDSSQDPVVYDRKRSLTNYKLCLDLEFGTTIHILHLYFEPVR